MTEFIYIHVCIHAYMYGIQLMWPHTEKSDSTRHESNICIKHQQSIYTSEILRVSSRIFINAFKNIEVNVTKFSTYLFFFIQ